MTDSTSRAEWMKTFAAPTKETFEMNPDGTYRNRFVEQDWQDWQAAKQSIPSQSLIDASFAQTRPFEFEGNRRSAQGEAVARPADLASEALVACLEIIDDVPQWMNAGHASNLAHKAISALAHPSAREAALEKALRELREEARKWLPYSSSPGLDAASAALGEGK